jgi:hypothetical protein
MERKLIKKKLFLALFAFTALNSFSSCAAVPQMDREDLSDPLMQVDLAGPESKLQGENFPRREGATGGDSGSGGGCGC